MGGARLVPGLVVQGLVLLLAAGCSAAGRTSVPGERPGDREAIAAASRAFSDAFVANDMEALGAVYTADAVLLPPGRELHGREAAMRYFAWPANRRQVAHAMKPAELVIRGDLAIDRGTWISTTQRGDEPPVTASGTYLVVWEREADGAWRIAYDMWHAPAPPAVPAVAPDAASGAGPAPP